MPNSSSEIEREGEGKPGRAIKRDGGPSVVLIDEDISLDRMKIVAPLNHVQDKLNEW